MRIVHVADYYQPKMGYQEPFIAKAHVEMGHEVHVVAANRFFPFPNYETAYEPVLGPRVFEPETREEDGVIIHHLPVWFEYAPSTWLMLKGFGKTLREIKPDILFSHSIMNFSAYLSANYKRELGYQLVFDNHASYINTSLTNSLIKRMYVAFWKTFIRPKIKKHAKTVIAIGGDERELASDVLDWPLEKLDLIPLGADTKRFKPDLEERERIRAELKIAPDDVLLTYTGKMMESKKTDLLLEAFAVVHKETPVLKLMLVGRGEPSFLETLKSRSQELGVQNEVIWIDMIPNTELPPYLNASDIGAWCGSPSNGIQEAIACALPIIVSDCKSTTNLVKGEGCDDNGFILKESSVDELSTFLRKLTNDADLRKKMGILSRLKSEKTFSWEKIAERFIEVAVN